MQNGDSPRFRYFTQTSLSKFTINAEAIEMIFTHFRRSEILSQKVESYTVVGKMFVRAFLTAILVASAASLYVEEYRQAPDTIRPDEITEITRFLRISTLEPEDPPYPPQPKVAEDEVPPINPKGSAQASCGITKFTFTAPNQTETLISQRYPWDYPKNQSCNYTLTSPPGTQISLECDTFHVACPKDQFAFSLDGGQTFSSYCGRGVISGHTTSGNSLLIRFTSSTSRPFSF